MKKAVLSVLIPILLVALGALGFVWWERGAPPGMRPTPVEVDPMSISLDNRGVSLKGTAHYEPRIRQTAGDEVWWVYPLLPQGDLEGRNVRVVVRTTRDPGGLYGYEDRTVVGFARPPGRLLTRNAREQIEQKGYILADDLVLVEEWTD
jgi:hypothetical protein